MRNCSKSRGATFVVTALAVEKTAPESAHSERSRLAAVAELLDRYGLDPGSVRTIQEHRNLVHEGQREMASGICPPSSSVVPLNAS